MRLARVLRFPHPSPHLKLIHLFSSRSHISPPPSSAFTLPTWRSFWSTKDDLILFRMRKTKTSYAKIASRIQTPPRTKNAISTHFHNVKGRLKDDGDLNAEWAKKYEIAGHWELREGCRYKQLQRWSSSLPVAQALQAMHSHEFRGCWMYTGRLISRGS